MHYLYYENDTSAIVDKYSSNRESQPRFDMKKWIEICGGASKERAYGFRTSKFKFILSSSFLQFAQPKSIFSAHNDN